VSGRFEEVKYSVIGNGYFMMSKDPKAVPRGMVGAMVLPEGCIDGERWFMWLVADGVFTKEIVDAHPAASNWYRNYGHEIDRDVAQAVFAWRETELAKAVMWRLREEVRRK
jgi:hypothetical protein